jgi:polysaccharide export outer membrane protein
MTGAPHELAKALTALEQRRVFPREAFLAATGAATGSRLVNRIARLLGRPQPRYAGAIPLMAMVVLTVAAISASAGLQSDVRVAAQPVAIAKPTAVPAPAAPAPVLIAQAPAEPVRTKAPQPPPSAAPAPRLEPPALPLYKLGSNDVLAVLVVDQPHLTGTYRVNGDGDLELPLVGKIHVLGLTLREAETEIVRRSVDREILSQPLVTVQLLRQSPAIITVVGDIKVPGQFTITSPITLYEALAKAGWTTTDAGANVLVSKSASDTPRIISLDDLQKSHDPSINVTLTGGEVVNVPDAPKVWVTGYVRRPGSIMFRMREGTTVLRVVGDARGLTEGYPETAYIYRADDNGRRHEIPIPLNDMMKRKAPDVRLQPDDILVIPDADAKSDPPNPYPQYYDAMPKPGFLEKAK